MTKDLNALELHRDVRDISRSQVNVRKRLNRLVGKVCLSPAVNLDEES